MSNSEHPIANSLHCCDSSTLKNVENHSDNELGKRACALDGGRVLRAFGYSLQGLRQAFATESAFRQEIVAFLVLSPLALLLPVSVLDRTLLLGSLLLVLIVELMNSAVEAVVDRISTEHHQLSGRAKDFGSAAVLLTILLAILVWGAVLDQLFSNWLALN